MDRLECTKNNENCISAAIVCNCLDLHENDGIGWNVWISTFCDGWAAIVRICGFLEKMLDRLSLPPPARPYVCALCLIGLTHMITDLALQ